MSSALDFDFLGKLCNMSDTQISISIFYCPQEKRHMETLGTLPGSQQAMNVGHYDIVGTEDGERKKQKPCLIIVRKSFANLYSL